MKNHKLLWTKKKKVLLQILLDINIITVLYKRSKF